MTIKQLANLYPYFSLLLLVAGVFNFRYLKKSVVATIPLFVLATTLFSLYITKYITNAVTYLAFINCIIIPFEFFYFIAFYYFLNPWGSARKLAVVCAVLYALVFCADLIIYKNTYTYLYWISYSTGSITLFILVVLYLYRLLNSDRILEFYKVPGFWISAGVLLFYLGSLPIHVLWNYTATLEPAALTISKNIFYILMYGMYCCFLIGIYCTKWTEQK